MKKAIQPYILYYISVCRVNENLAVTIKLASGDTVEISNRKLIQSYHQDLIQPSMSFIEEFIHEKLKLLKRILGLHTIDVALKQIQVYSTTLVPAILNRIVNRRSILSAFNDYYKCAPTPEKVYTYRILCNYYLNQGSIEVIDYYRRKEHRAIVDFIDAINLVGLSPVDHKGLLDDFWYFIKKIR